MIKADTPNLWEIRNHTDHPTAIGIIVLALLYTARLVNVESNLNEDQIGEIANDVLNDYGYLKVEEVKYILKTAVRTKKIFGRLDYNVVMEWFEEYDSKRTEEAMSLSDSIASHEEPPSPEAMSWAQYQAKLKEQAESGDEAAQAKIKEIEEVRSTNGMRLLTKEQKYEKERDFKQYFFNEYLKGRK